MQSQHRYICIGSHGKRDQYLSLQQPSLLLAWLLYWYGKPLGFRGHRLRQALGGCKRLFCGIITLLYHHLFSPNANDVLELPVAGHLCLRVRNGYKVFDLRRKIVAKVFTPNINLTKIRREIVWARRVGGHRLAPRVRSWNVEERWYEEDYVNGYSGTASAWREFLHTLQESFIPLFARAMLASPPREVWAVKYAQGRSELVRSSKLLDKRLGTAKVAMIRSFVDGIIEQLYRVGDCPISLVWSHGDFTPSHVLTTAHGTVIIDWETAGYRTALFDLYHTFFRRLRGQPAAPGMAAALERAISQLQGCLALHAPTGHSSLISSLDTADVYRWIYYIEYIYSYVEKGKMKDRHLDSILFFIDAFNHYEERLLDGTGQSHTA